MGVSTGGEAVARLCPDVDSEITLPDEWTAKTPADLRFVVVVQDGDPKLAGRCGPYSKNGLGVGEVYAIQETQFVDVSLVNTQTGKIEDTGRVNGPAAGTCPLVIPSNTTTLLQGSPSKQDVQKEIVFLLSNQIDFQTQRTLTGHTNSVTSVAFSPDGKLLASGSRDQTIKLWDVASGQAVRTLTGHTDKVTSVAFSPDGKLLASGSDDETVKLWDVASGQEVRTLMGHTDFVTSVAFSPDGNLLASGSWDKTVMVWDVGTGEKIYTLKTHIDPEMVGLGVETIAFSPDGILLALGGGMARYHYGKQRTERKCALWWRT